MHRAAGAEPPDEPPPPRLWETVQSVAAAFFGVQNRRNRERDFTRGRPLHFILIGLGMTVLFVLVLVVAVRLALRGAGL
jgi:hypothetical protein